MYESRKWHLFPFFFILGVINSIPPALSGLSKSKECGVRKQENGALGYPGNQTNARIRGEKKETGNKEENENEINNSMRYPRQLILEQTTWNLSEIFYFSGGERFNNARYTGTARVML